MKYNQLCLTLLVIAAWINLIFKQGSFDPLFSMDIKIIDDFLDKEEFNTIKYTLLHNSFPWFLRQVLDDEIENLADRLIRSMSGER